MAETHRFEHWTLKINDGDTRKDIIEALLQVPEDVIIDLSTANYETLWLRFEKDDSPS